MMARIVLIIVFFLMCPLVRAQDTNLLNTISPNLKKFLNDHPTAIKAFTNAVSEAFSNKTVRLYYFYSTDPNERKAHHFYTHLAEGPDVVVCVAEELPPADEYICVLYETLNSKGEKRLEALIDMAAAGTISRTDFARDILSAEFDAIMQTRGLLLNLGLGKEEIKQSHYYGYFVEMPTNFEGFLSYQEKLFPPHQGSLEQYELKYDAIRKSQQQ